MLYLIVSFVFFIFSILIHVLVCRLRKNSLLYAKLFGYIAIVNLLICIYVFQFIDQAALHFAPLSVWFIQLKSTLNFIYLLLIPAYLVIYVTTQLNSPSKIILKLLSKGEGLSFNNLQKQFSDEEWIVSRLNELVQTGCVVEIGGRYRLGASGKLIGGWLKFYQLLLGNRPRG